MTAFLPGFEIVGVSALCPECKGLSILGGGLIGCFACDFTGTLEGYRVLEDAEKALGDLPGFEQLALREEAAGTVGVENPITGQADDLISTEATSGFKRDVVKGVDSTDTLAARMSAQVDTLGSNEEESMHRPLAAKGLHTTQTLSVRSIDFQVQAFVRSLSPVVRAAVAARRRFHTMPWLRRAADPDSDDLP